MNQEKSLIQALIGLDPYANLVYADWLQEHGRDTESDAWRLVENESFFLMTLYERVTLHNYVIIDSFSSNFTVLAHRLRRNKWKGFVAAGYRLVSIENKLRYMDISTTQCEEKIFLQILDVLYQASHAQQCFLLNLYLK